MQDKENKPILFDVPYKIKEKLKIFKNITIKDFFVLLAIAGIGLLIMFLNFHPYAKIGVVIALTFFSFVIMMPIRDDIKLYSFMLRFLKFNIRNHQQKAINFANIDLKIDQNIVKYNGMYLTILELETQDYDIMSKNEKLKTLSDFREMFEVIELGKIIKMPVPVDYSEKIAFMQSDYCLLKQANPNRAMICKNAIENLTFIYEEKLSKKDTFYLIVYASTKTKIEEQVQQLQSIQLFSNLHQLTNQEIKVFFKSYYNGDIENKDFHTFQLQETLSNISLNDEKYKVLNLVVLPQILNDAWLTQIFRKQETITSLAFFKITDNGKIRRQLDRTIIELQAQLDDKNLGESKKAELSQKIERTQLLIEDLTNGNEKLFSLDISVLIQEKEAKQFLNDMKLRNLVFSSNYFNQLTAFNNQNPLYAPSKSAESLILTSSVCGGSFPLITDFFQDKHGDFLGFNADSMVFFDLFHNLRRE